MSGAAAAVFGLLRQRGFLFPTAQIYNGLRGSFDLGPLGVAVKRRIQEEWWRHTVTLRPDVHGFESPILTPARALVASGHVQNFSDLLVDCRLTGQRFRADKAQPLKLTTEVRNGRAQQVLSVTAPDKATAKAWEETLRKSVVPGARIRRDVRTVKLYVAEVVPPVVLPANAEGTYDKVGYLRFERDVPDAEPNAAMDALSDDKFTASPPTTPPSTVDIEYRGYVNPQSNSPFLTEPRPFNLLFKTFIDPIDPIERIISTVQSSTEKQQQQQQQQQQSIRATVDEQLASSTVYLRPETAQGVYTAFPHLVKALNLMPPFGIAQVGKAFRNEIRTEHMLYRTFEFEQMELQYFVPPWEAQQHFEAWQHQRFSWWLRYASDKKRWRVRPHAPNELAHYAKACVDVEFEFPWGWGELEGVANRGDYDLCQHETHSDVSMSVFDQSLLTRQFAQEHHVDGQQDSSGGMTPTARYRPYVIESSCGLSRALLALLVDAYREERKSLTPEPTGRLGRQPDESTTTRAYLRLHPRLAPYTVAVVSLVNRPELQRYEDTVYQSLVKAELVAYVERRNIAIGKKYYLADEIGTPVTITVDFETPRDKKVTLRHRDTLQQKRVKVYDVADAVHDMIKNW
ncbi:hypothetical protein RI367_008101 [Sorochytrium milnesiophthora]